MTRLGVRHAVTSNWPPLAAVLAAAPLGGVVVAVGWGPWAISITLALLWISVVTLESDYVIETMAVVGFALWYLPPISVNLGFKSFDQIQISLLAFGVPFLARKLLLRQFKLTSKFSFLFLIYSLLFVQAVLRLPFPSFSRAAMDGSRQIFGFFLAVVCYLTIVNFVTSERRMHLLAKGLFIGTVLGVLVSLVLFFAAPASSPLITFTGVGYSNYGYQGYESVVFSSLVNVDNRYPAQSSALGIAILLASGGKLASRKTIWATAAMLLLGLLLGSRAGFFGFVFMLGLYALATRRVGRIVPLILLLAAAGIGATLAASNWSSQIMRMFDFSLAGSTTASSTLRRLEVWNAIIGASHQNWISLLLGSGVGTFISVVGSRYGFSDPQHALDLGYTSPHSLYMDSLLVMGLSGMCIVVVILVKGQVSAWRLFRSSLAGIWSSTALWLLMILFYAFVTNSVGGGLNDTKLVLYLSLLSTILSLVEPSSPALTTRRAIASNLRARSDLYSNEAMQWRGVQSTREAVDQLEIGKRNPVSADFNRLHVSQAQGSVFRCTCPATTRGHRKC